MLTYVKPQNMFEINADCYVVTVNCVGVMGKGVALEAKKQYPEMFKQYKAACNRGDILPGGYWLWASNTPNLPANVEAFYRAMTVVCCIATKDHWQSPSQYKWVYSGILNLAKILTDLKDHGKRIKIVIPPLGCGNGGLGWHTVKRYYDELLSGIDQDIIAVEPY